MTFASYISANAQYACVNFWRATLDCRCYGQHSHENKSRTVLDKTYSYKWFCCILCKTQLIFLRINGPNVYIFIVSHQVMTHSFNIKASFWKIYFILKLLCTSSKSKLIYSHLPLADFSQLIFHKHLHKISYIFSLFQPFKYLSFSPKKV